jgi:hypothetical protein
MQRVPVLVVTSAALWAAAIGADAGDVSGRIWRPLLSLATAAAIATAVQLMLRSEARTYRALADAMLTRPLYRDPTGPLPAVPEQPAAPASNGHTRHGRHETRARA